MKRTLLAAALLGLAAAALPGCDGGSDKVGSNVSKQQGGLGGGAFESGGASGLPDRYDPPLALTTVDFTFGVAKYAQGDDRNDNPWTRYLRDRFGIIVHKLWEAPGKPFEQKKDVMIATGDIPDFFLASPTQLVQLYKADMIADLTEVYERFAPEAVRRVVEEAGPEVMQAAVFDGRLMALPHTGTAKELASILWIREDWMNRLQLPAPQTMDDVLRIAEAFTLRDPDGNGQDDTYGIGLDKNLSFASGFLNGYHAYRSIWTEDGEGQLAYSSIQPEMKTALQKLRGLYESGFIDPQFGVKDSTKVYESIAAGKVGMIYGGISTGKLYQYSPDHRWLPFPAPSVDAEPTRFSHGLNIYQGFWVVKKGSPHPEALLRMAEQFVNLFYYNTSDELYKMFNYDSDKVLSIWQNAPVRLYRSYKNAEIYKHLEPYLQSPVKADPSQLGSLTPEERLEYNSIMDFRQGKLTDWSRAARSDTGGAGQIVLDYIRNDLYMPDLFLGPPTPTMVRKRDSLIKMENELFIKLILGTAPLDDFDKFVRDWKRLGGDEITKEVNEGIAQKEGLNR